MPATETYNGMPIAGPTSDRPTAKAAIGARYFDTDLGKDLVYGGPVLGWVQNISADPSGTVSARIIPRSGTLATIQALAGGANEPQDGELLYLTDLKVNALWNATNHAPDYYSQAIWDHVAAYYPLSETSGNRYDMKGNGQVLTNNNSVGSETGQCNTKRALFTSASSMYLEAANTTALQCGDVHLTIMGLVRFTTSADMTFLYKGLGAGAPGDLEYGLQALSSTLYFSAGTSGSDNFVSGGAVSTATTYFVVAQHNPRTDKIRISVTAITAANMVAFTEATHTGGIPTTTNTLLLGQHGFGSLYFNGSLEEVAIIKNRELTSAELESFFQKVRAGRPLFR